MKNIILIILIRKFEVVSLYGNLNLNLVTRLIRPFDLILELRIDFFAFTTFYLSMVQCTMKDLIINFCKFLAPFLLLFAST